MIILRIFTVILVLIFTLICIIFISRLHNARKSKITTKNGIQESCYISIGGIKQYLLIRGKNKENPIILWLHGGPGFPQSFLSYYYLKPLENDYTIVSWEQRGCGRTYLKNKNKNKDLSFDLLISDIDEIIEYLRERFNKEKVILIGHSWGTVLGTCYAAKYPEKVGAYIGTGQVTDYDSGKIYSAKLASDIARQRGYKKDSKSLRNVIHIFKQENDVKNLDVSNFNKMMILSMIYLDKDKLVSRLNQIWKSVSSPDIGFIDFEWMIKSLKTKIKFASQYSLIQYLFYTFDVYNSYKELKVPVCFIQGESDWITPTKYVHDYFDILEAPLKKLVITKQAGHSPFVNKLSEFCNEVKTFLKNDLPHKKV